MPSGASRGRAEAIERRDDGRRYGGFGCRQAAASIATEFGARLRGHVFTGQKQLDEALCAIDGTDQKSRLGANAALAVSLAFARAAAREQGIELYEYFAQLASAPRPLHLPALTVNLFSGGHHAGMQVAVQDVLVAPLRPSSMDEALETVAAVYSAAEDLVRERYGMRALTADEGGLAPPFASVEDMLDDAVESIRGAGFEPGRDVALAVDVASSHFFVDGVYRLGREVLTTDAMIERLMGWIDAYPIVSVEDGLGEEDWEGWRRLRRQVAGRVMVLGDDLLCTHTDRIRRAIELSAADALLLKVNQVGTVSEACEALCLARSADWRVTVSARSGETEDSWLADLAVGWGGDQIKVGSVRQSERLSKYNRLLVIEADAKLEMHAFDGSTWRPEVEEKGDAS